MTNAFILGLDISSTAIGYCLYNGVVWNRGVIRLDSDAWIGVRCVAARDALAALLDVHVVDAIAVESPVARWAKAVIPQARMSGVILELAERHGIVTCEVTPTAAKRALCDDGAATKREMLQAAAGYFGSAATTLVYRERHAEWAAWLDGCMVPEYTEHEADALGVAIAAAKVVTVEVAA